MAQDILVVGELADGALSATTVELLGAAVRLAEGGRVSVTLLGSAAPAAAAPAFAAGADRAFVSGDGGYEPFRSDPWVAAVQAAITQAQPAVVLLAQSTVGRDLGPRLAFRLDTAAAMDCVQLAIEGGSFRATRPCFGGNALASYSFATSPAIATARAKSQDALDPPRAGATGETVALPGPAEARTEVTGREQAAATGLRLQDAPVVVSGGRGLGGPEGFRLIEQLAAAIGTHRAAVGSSRAACDMGWYPVSQQVGLTGKVVTPDLYIAVAISGASQHMAGCSGAKAIVAINRDPEANIFKAARYGIVGDYKLVLPPLIEAIRALD
ncbi:MAG: electron transfer flavoprotein subunit alpha/FixB family protein [Dehalococcoidia bacterium]|nr:electron transfer flavoprotein subunit alpha/FixB family protein [Dehalococcoidia bacterium]